MKLYQNPSICIISTGTSGQAIQALSRLSVSQSLPLHDTKNLIPSLTTQTLLMYVWIPSLFCFPSTVLAELLQAYPA